MRLPLVVALLAAANSASAQMPDGVIAGMRVRATITGASGSETYTGKILQLRGDSVVLRESPSSPIFMFSSRQLTSLEVSDGKPFSGWSAFKTAGLVGAVIGGVVGYQRYDPDGCLPPTTACRNVDVAISAVVGGAIGGGIGIVSGLLAKERWTPVVIQGRTVGMLSTPAPIKPGIRTIRQGQLDSLRAAGKLPGVTFGIALADGRTIGLASGESDTSRHTAMFPTDRLLEGSVGKTYVSAVAMQLVAEGKLDLGAKIEKYLSNEPWFNRLPNAHDITVRQLMQHTSGLVRYEFQPEATAVLRANPYEQWTRASTARTQEHHTIRSSRSSRSREWIRRTEE